MHVVLGMFSSFITLLVTTGPVETAVVFAAITVGVHHAKQLSLARHSTTVAGIVLPLFALGGNLTLGLLHIPIQPFAWPVDYSFSCKR